MNIKSCFRLQKEPSEDSPSLSSSLVRYTTSLNDCSLRRILLVPRLNARILLAVSHVPYTFFYSVPSSHRPYHTYIHPSEFRKDPTGVDVHCALCTLMLGLEHKKAFFLCIHKIKFIEETPYKGV